MQAGLWLNHSTSQMHAHVHAIMASCHDSPCMAHCYPVATPLAGNNQLAQLDNVMYLRQFRQLRLVNLAGNPICKDHDYRSYVLSHIKDLTYLDYRRVAAADVQAAREAHQVSMHSI